MNKYWLSLYTDPIYNLKLSFATFSPALFIFIHARRKEKKGKEKSRQAGGWGKTIERAKQKADLGGKGKVQRLINILGQVPGDFNDSPGFLQALVTC